MLRRTTAGLLLLLLANARPAPSAHALPLWQSALDASARDLTFPRWSPDGQWAYFQYALDPRPILVGNQPDDPWSRVSRDGRRVEQVQRLTPRVTTTQVTFSDSVNDSGVVVTRNTRPKVGTPVAVRRAMIVAADPRATPDSVRPPTVEMDDAWFGGAGQAPGWLGAGVEHPNELHLYELPLRGGPLTRIEALGEGELAPTPSPDGQVLALRWSDGGFFTLMALFKGYTARILNGTPAEDTTAYRVSSPIYHAEGLRDRLQLQHGLVDGNVQYQDAVRLVQRMMELGKDFDFVTFPIDAHGWQTRWARIDSPRRMMRLWEEVLLR